MSDQLVHEVTALDFHHWKDIAADIRDRFNGLNDAQRDNVMILAALFHYRDGKKHNDGSMGTIAISPKQLRDLLAYVMTKFHDKG